MRITALHVRPPLGRLVHRGWRPAPGDPLASLVETVTDCEGEVLHARERVFPSPGIDLVVHLDEPYRVWGPRGPAPFPTACVTGILMGPMVMEPPAAPARGVAVRLRPAGARALLGLPLHELSGRTLDLFELMPRDAAELLGRCHAARTGEARVAAMRAWLSARLRDGRRDEAVAWAVEQIVRHDGAIRIDTLRDRTGRSWARLAAGFRDQVGVTPKRYARIVRFRRALALAHASPRLPLSALALAAGYYDQAHLTAELRALAGLTPRQLRASPWYPEAVSVAEWPDRGGEEISKTG